MRLRAPRRRRAPPVASPAVLSSQVPMFGLVGAQVQDRVVELARHGAAATRRRRPPRSRATSAGCGACGARTGSVAAAPRAIDGHRRHARSAAVRLLVRARCGAARRRARAAGARSRRRAAQRALRIAAWNCRRLGDGVDQPPVDLARCRARLRWSCRRCRRGRGARGACRSGASARRCRAARRAAALRATDTRRGTVVDEQDLVAGERQFVAAARARAVDRREELQVRRTARSPPCRCASRW